MTRIATVGYLNARPLTSHIDRDRFEVVQGHPSDIARMLADGEVDVALVPVAAALSDGDYRVVGEVCIGAEGPVHSVLLVAETPPEQWTEVVLDGVSRTSRTLARLLLTQGPLAARVPKGIKIVEGAQMQGLAKASGTVAGLVIGDAARQLPDRLSHRVDLAESWHEWTGYPFVFAVWAGRPDVDPEVIAHLRAAGRAGLAARAQDYAGADLEYVTRSIRYDLDDRALIGFRRYAALAFKAGLVGQEEVEFYGPGRRGRARVDVDGLLATAADGGSLGPEELDLLARDARTVDLTAAASFAREARVGPMQSVAWTPAVRIDVTSTVLTPDEVAEQVAASADIDAGEVILTGSLHPGVGTDGWCRWISAAAGAGDAKVRALSLRGLRHLSAMDDLDPIAVLERLREAGLHDFEEDAILALDASVRSTEQLLSPRQWLGLAEAVMGAGFRFHAGLEVGAGESVPARVAHLLELEQLQGRGAGFTALRVLPLSEGRGIRPSGATAEDYLRTVALARLAVPSVAHHEAAWLVGAPGLCQSALHAGADLLGAVPLPPRQGSSDSDFNNPRAAVGKKAENDPWAEVLGAVQHHLKRSGFRSDRRGAEPALGANSPSISPRPHV